MSIESLKQQARRHEQDEQWQKALDQYQKAIRELEKEEQTDIGLINRVGDLYVRVGKLDDAVDYYEQAVDLYREAFLPNNAIAVCKKIIRNVPNRHQAYLKIGQIRAEQGFLSDARTNFLTYAERMQKAGDLDESFRALVEFCDLAPDDVDVRITVADQMAANQRTDDAVAQLLLAYGRLTQSGEGDLASGVEKKILEMDPSADLSAAAAAGATAQVDDVAMEFGEIDLGGGVEPEPFAAPDVGELRTAAEHFVADAAKSFEVGSDEGDYQGEEDEAVAAGGSEDDTEVAEDEEGDFELPIMSFEADSEVPDAEEGAELPMMSLGADEEESEAVELPTLDLGDDSQDEATELPILGFDENEEEAGEAVSTAGFGGVEEEEDTEQVLESLPSLSLEEAREEARSEGREEPSLPPAAAPADKGSGHEPDGGYIDLGAMVFGGEGAKKSTRFKVAYEEPTGDEVADFAKMLSQFKDKVSENIETGDVRAHYDLGTAYKEMGLLEEAIGAFQSALRASAEHLPTYELMGQTFIEMGQPEAAVRTLQRALKIRGGVEDEFVGIYYYLARAYEELDRKESAVEFYDRVFSLDINFADVTERLRELR